MFFGTYDERRHPRVTVLRQGLEAHGHDVRVVNVPLALDTAARVQLAAQPWRLPLVTVRLVGAWLRLIARSLRERGVDVVVVGYMGHLDVHLARCRWPRAHVVLDHMVALADTLADRRFDSSSLVARLAEALDRAATRRADTIVVDTAQQELQLPSIDRPRAVVVPVGAPVAWFAAVPPQEAPETGQDRLSIVYFGLYTPLHGATTIGEAIAKLRGQPVSWTMVGTGQERAATEAAAGPEAPVRWLDWVDAAVLPDLVAAHDVCLGIFGTGPKAHRVVPNKVFQGAAARCAVITSNTPSQREVLDGAAILVPPGDSAALSEVIMGLVSNPAELEEARRSARAVAERRFTPHSVVGGLTDRLDRSLREPGLRGGLPALSPNAALRWHLVRRRVGQLAPGRILELGAGQGAVAARLARVADYVGVEPDDTSRATSRSRLPAGARLVADLSEVPGDETFDLACAFEVLEHIDDDVGALAAWVDRVRPGGHVLVSVPADPERFGAADELVGHVRRYSPLELAALLSAGGLDVVAVDRYGFPLGTVLEAGRNAISKRKLASGGAPLDPTARTAGSGRQLQPPAWAGAAIWAVSAPFRFAQCRFPGRGPGLLALARRPG
jgi:glycosyltransferase involved in cell wall biosynthesis